ncbi:DUF4124 domain-containing protein [Luteimonas sp. 50]|uniref:DUF4124 domain-containing protein n=1 Tax=Cognatiluteimonas sedimenti TaxID=2927791 RepID=A0ABT0A6P9_9GAMM|nr:DUF4124 domain-containing protein [Lysobacter sedimenti]MCJ0826665.1 DUF4124 domain-containing protein [Lysobacter sedimenti]
MSPSRLLLAAAMLASAAMPLSAQSVYQWKDANGVTQYSSTPPASGTFKQRSINTHGAPETATAAAKPAEDKACETARKNINLLKGDAALQVDSDGDGKPDKTLSDDDRTNQLQLAQATLNVKCPGTHASANAEAAADGR